MPNADAGERVRIGVLLDQRPSDLTAWLADAAAFDAAGADSLWVDPLPEASLDPVALMAALAVVTHRSLLVVGPSGLDSAAPRRTAGPATMASPERPAGLATVVRLARGRLRVRAEFTGDIDVPAGATLLAYRGVGGDPSAAETVPEDGSERPWLVVAVPEGRASWRVELRDAAGRGGYGVVVAADSRMLDILRNPDDDGDRRDLQLAMG